MRVLVCEAEAEAVEEASASLRSSALSSLSSLSLSLFLLFKLSSSSSPWPYSLCSAQALNHDRSAASGWVVVGTLVSRSAASHSEDPGGSGGVGGGDR